MRVQIELASPRAGEWYVVSGGTYLVGFSGVHAHELALKQKQELTELLNATPACPAADADDLSSAVKDD
ncbi:MAG: hypothetical protein GEU82_00830 [Luteitalea sp.]|nr:hypothetical protein [Luteitalea sp.]